ncbi:MAG TPA: TlpA disulfide reductase family protein, partial [Chitinophagaceae bacterium]|nr:TlpA disulfide reductase family protein [Chitinophagaceae bacterium]
MKAALFCFSLVFCNSIFAQPLITTGDIFPNYILRPVVNAPQSQVDVWSIRGKYIFLNFWGTWCAPCIPEMDSLGKLQKKYANFIQVIGVSNDPKENLVAYLKKRPTTVWLASDMSANLYRQAGFSFVGQTMILDPQKKIIALVKTDSINNTLIQQLIRGKNIVSNAEVNARSIQQTGDAFGIDSSVEYGVSIRAYMPGKPSMSTTYRGTALEGRRLTYYNICPTTLFRDAYNITSPEQVVYETDQKQLCNFDNKATLLCFDLVVKPSRKDSLKLIMQQKLNSML